MSEEKSTSPPDVRVSIPVNDAGGGGYGAVGPDTDIPPPLYSAQPPTYQAATDVDAAPPTYESLYGEFRNVNTPRTFWQWLLKAVGILVGTVAAAVVLAVLNAVPIYMIVVGSLNVHGCNIEKYIPIWLIVCGAFSLIKSLSNFYYRAKRSQDGQEHSPTENVNPNPFDGLLSCFLLIWFITGTVWVYRNYAPTYDDPNRADYCDQLTYMSAFVIITITYCFSILAIFFACCCGCIAICFCATEQNE